MNPVRLLLILVVACNRHPAPVGTPGDAGVAIAPAPSARPSEHCAALSAPVTIAEGGGRAHEDGYLALENLRVLAMPGASVVTWERQSRFVMGDTWRAPYAAVQSGGDAFRVVEFPVDAYACATYGAIAPSTLAAAVTWGVHNTSAFELWDKLAGGVPPRPKRRVVTPRQDVRTFVVSGKVALAATLDGPCDLPCSCPKGWKPALWVYGLDPEARFAERIALGSTEMPASLDNDVPTTPALVMGEHGGAAAFRAGRTLNLVWLDPAGKPKGTPLHLDEGELGAPALALAGPDVIAVWARRETKSAPYRLQWSRLAAFGSPSGARHVPTAGSALAPAVLADDESIVLAWMEGDAERRGAIYVARSKLDEARFAGRLISTPEETNARDPELSGTVGEPVLVYAAFSKTQPGGEVRFTRLRCGER